MTRLPLHWVCQSPSPYNDVLFRTLSGSRVFGLQLHYLQADCPEYFWTTPSSRYSFRFLRKRPLDWALIRAVLGDRKSIFLTACWHDPTSQFILSALIVRRRPYLIWNDTPTTRRRNWIKEQLRRKFLSTVLSKATAVLGTGKPAMQVLANLGAPINKLVNFPYCVDLEHFAPRRSSGSSERVVLGTCARLHRIKGLDLAIRAIARLVGSGVTGFHYRIAGAGPEELALRSLTAGLGMSDYVDFCGWIQPEDLPNFYHSLDAYLHPARFEPYGVSVIEALACGLPVLASDQTMAALDRVIEGESGFLHAANDEAALCCAIETFLQLSEQKRLDMGRAARRSALTWTADRALETVDQLISESCNRVARELVARSGGANEAV